MKYFIIILTFFCCNTQNVTGFDFMDYVSNKFTDMKVVVKSHFDIVKEKMQYFFYDSLKDAVEAKDKSNVISPVSVLSRLQKEKVKRAFSDFVEEAAAESEIEMAEYEQYKSEPTALMSTAQLVTLQGRRVESHTVETADGYLLTVHRIKTPTHLQIKSDAINGLPILMHHGLLGSSADWIIREPDNSLAFILSTAGADVWLANARGNYYSRGHRHRKLDSPQFWDFSFEEIGQYDIPALIDYILQVRNNSAPINFIGHSMGASALLVCLSTKPQYNNLLRMGILLAPLAYMKSVESPMRVLTEIKDKEAPITGKDPPELVKRLLENGEFVPNRKLPKWMVLPYCQGPTIFCTNPLFFLAGLPNIDDLDRGMTARMLYHVPAGGSTRTILHYTKLLKNSKFHSIDGSEYPVHKITVPLVLFSSSDDLIATIPDVLRLYFSVGNPVDQYIIRGKNFTHTDFAWGSDAKQLVYDKVLEYLEGGQNLSHINEIFKE